MRAMPVPRLALPPAPAALALIAVAFVLPGLASHDPWKTHDVIGLAIVHGMALSGDVIVPRVAGLVWLYDPPLYHWIAAAFGKIGQFVMEFHSAARLASGAFMAAALWLIYVTARDWTRDEDGRSQACAALLILLGSVGLMVHAHEAVPELASLAAMGGALATLPYAVRKPVHAGALFGAALGFAFLSANWIGPASLGIAVAAAHAVCPEWRTRNAMRFLGVAAAVAAVLALSWPLALFIRSRELFSDWWQLAGYTQSERLPSLRYYLATGSWFAWPAWPLALWAMWSLRRRSNDPRLFVPSVAIVLMLAGISYWGPAQDVNLIPLLAPLALLAAMAVFSLRRGAAAALDWFGVLTFAFFAGLVWLGYIGMMTGLPPRVAANFERAAPGFVPRFDVIAFVIALALTVGWVYVVFFTASSPLRSLARWAAGIVLLWGTFAMLWMPWADYQKSYRSVALQLRSKIPVAAPCVAQRGLGVSQAAALDYHAGIRPRPFDVVKPAACPLLIVQGNPRYEFDAPGPGWIKLADVGRPGDRGERYRLYRLK